MGDRYQVEIRVGRQEDGLWRAEVPGLRGCWVDAATLAQAIADIQEVAAMAIDDYREQGWVLPTSVTLRVEEAASARIPVVVSEHEFTRAKPRHVQQDSA